MPMPQIICVMIAQKIAQVAHIILRMIGITIFLVLYVILKLSKILVSVLVMQSLPVIILPTTIQSIIFVRHAQKIVPDATLMRLVNNPSNATNAILITSSTSVISVVTRYLIVLQIITTMEQIIYVIIALITARLANIMTAILIMKTLHAHYATISPLQIIHLVLVIPFQNAIILLIIKLLIIGAMNVLKIVQNADLITIIMMLNAQLA
jgi:hypothetical protein